MTARFFRALAFLIVVAGACPPSSYSIPDSRDPEAWYARARLDLESASLIHRELRSPDQVCFLSHQAVEKLLKGSLIESGQEAPRTHDSADLLRRLGKPELISFFENRLGRMDALYVSSRYPKTDPMLQPDTGDFCLQTAVDFFDRWMSHREKSM